MNCLRTNSSQVIWQKAMPLPEGTGSLYAGAGHISATGAAVDRMDRVATVADAFGFDTGVIPQQFGTGRRSSHTASR